MKSIRWFVVTLALILAISGCSLQAAQQDKEEPTTQMETEAPLETEVATTEVQTETEAATEGTAITLSSTEFLQGYERESVKLPYQPSGMTGQVPAYEVAADFSNIVNFAEFGEFTEAQKEMLLQSGFVVCSPEGMPGELAYDQFFHIYDANEYKRVPSFVTGDSMTHIFHIFYDSLLRSTERDQIYPKLQDMTSRLLASNIEIYENLTDVTVKDLQLKNVAYFAVAAHLLDVDTQAVPEEAKALIDEELANIDAKSSTLSNVSNSDVDYSQMTVRGHYTRDETLEKYFLGTMYYGQVGFYPFDQKGKPQVDAIAQAMLMTHSAYKDQEIFRAWSEAVDPIDFMVESSEDLSIREMAQIFYAVYGQEPDLDALLSEPEMNAVAGMIKELPDPLIDPAKGKSFRFIPQRAVMDSVIAQDLVDIMSPSNRPIYSGLDIMASFGSEKAKEIQYEDPYNAIWPEYKERLENNIDIVSKMTDENWQKNLYRGWLWMLKEYANEYGEGYPMFMQSEAWKRKDLASALGSWAELKHDTVLYGKQVGAQKGGGEEPEPPYGYVEPNLPLFEKLSWLLEYTQLNLADRGMLGDNEMRLDNFRMMVDFCIDVIKKELNNEPLTESEKYQINNIGGVMESVSTKFVESDGEFSIGYWWEIESATDRRMPIVGDLMTTVRNNCGIPEGQYLHAASGAPNEIYVIYPHDGQLYMGRGGVFSYYEFLDPERLTDEIWQERVISGQPELPAWKQDLVHDGKGEVIGTPPAY